jgi:hypothetical protein
MGTPSIMDALNILRITAAGKENMKVEFERIAVLKNTFISWGEVMKKTSSLYL